MKLSIRNKLILFTVSVVLLVGGSIALHSFYQGRELILTDFERDARETAALVAGSVANDLYRLEVHSLRVRIGSAMTNPDVRHIYVMDKEGVVLAESSNENALRNKKLTGNLSREMLLARDPTSRVHAGHLIAGAPVLLPDGDRIGYLQIIYSLDLMSQIVHETTRSVFQITVIFLGIGVVLAVLLSVSFSRPILSIMQASKEIGEGKLDTRLLVKRADELGRLAGSVNRMAEALQKRQSEAEQKTRELQALYTLANAISRSLNLDSCLPTALLTTIEVLKADAGRLYIIEAKDRMLRLTTQHGLPTDQLSGIESYAPGEGIVGRTFKEKRPMVFADMATDPIYAAMARGGMGKSWGFHSAAGLPITVKNQPVGVICIYGRAVREFTQQDVELLSAIGDQIGVAIENARLFTETKRNLEGIRALHEIDTAITSTLDLHRILDVLMQKVDLFLPYSTATVSLFNQDSGLLEPVACRNLDEKEWKLEQRKAGRSPSHAVFESKAPMMIPNCYTDQRVGNPGFFRRYALASYLGVPMIAKEENLGVLSFYTKEEHEYTAEEVEFLSTLAGQAAIAIHNSQLYEEARVREAQLQESNKMLSALHAVAAAASQSLVLDQVLDAAIEKVTETFGFDATRIHIYNERRDELLLKASFENNPEHFTSARSFPRAQSILGKVAESGEPLIFQDIEINPPYQQLSRIKIMGQFGYHFFAVFPIRGKLRNLGTLSCVGISPRKLSPSEIQLLEAVTDQIAVAMENSELYEHLKQKVKELQQKTEELERADKVKDEFLSVMSHELRTPLNVLMGYTAMIKDGMLGETNREQEGALEKVLAQANDLLTMITSVLYATSIETREVRSEPHRFALGAFLDELRSACDVPRDKALALIWKYAPDLPAVETDSEKLKYILHNLIHNAIKFTERGQVTISARIKGAGTKRVTDGDQQPGNGKEEEELIEFKVADTGIGISQEKLPLIFEKFRQIDSSDTRPYGGIGLGLYVTKNFAELLGGKIELETEQGKGSTFTVSIPCVLGSAATDGSQKNEQHVLGPQDPANPLSLGLGPRSQEL